MVLGQHSGMLTWGLWERKDGCMGLNVWLLTNGVLASTPSMQVKPKLLKLIRDVRRGSYAGQHYNPGPLAASSSWCLIIAPLLAHHAPSPPATSASLQSTLFTLVWFYTSLLRLMMLLSGGRDD
jgi:hypothetical protein